MTFCILTHPTFTVFELLKEGEVLVVPTDNPMTEKEAWLAFRDVVHGLEYRESCLGACTNHVDRILGNFDLFTHMDTFTK